MFSLTMSHSYPRKAWADSNIEAGIFTDILHSNSCNDKKVNVTQN